MKIFCNLNNINKKTIVITESQSNILKYRQYLKEKNENISDDFINEVIIKLNRYINESYGISKGVIALSNYLKELILKNKGKEIEINKSDNNLTERIYSLPIDLPTDETKLEDLYLKRKKDIKTVNVIMTIKNYNFTNRQSYENYIKDKGEFDLTQSTSYKEINNNSYGFINFSYVSISGQPTKSFYSDLNHELSHYYEQFMAGNPYGKANKMINVINNLYNDKDIIKIFAKTLYYCDEAEQDSAINGLYAYVINNIGNNIDFKTVDKLIKEDTAFRWLTELEYNVQIIKNTDLNKYKKILAQKFNIHDVNTIIKYFEKQLHRFYKKFDKVVKGIKIELKLTESLDKARNSLPYQLLLNRHSQKTIVITESQLKTLNDNENYFTPEELLEETVTIYNRTTNETRGVNVKKLRLENRYLGKVDLATIPENKKGTLDEVIFKINSCICETYGISQGIRQIGYAFLKKISEKRKNGDYTVGERGDGYETRIYKTSLSLPNEEEEFGDYYLYDKTPENKKEVSINITFIEYYFKSQDAYSRFIKEYGEDLNSWSAFNSNKYTSLGFLTVVYPSIKGNAQRQFYSNLEHEITHFYQQNRMDKRYPNTIKMVHVNNNMVNSKNDIVKKVSRILYLCDDAEQEAMKHGMYAYIMKSMDKNDIDPRNVDKLAKNDTAFKYLTELDTLVQWLKNNYNDVEQYKGELKSYYQMRSVGQLIRYAEHKLERFYRLFGRTIKKIKKDKGMLESVDAMTTPTFALMEYEYNKSPKLSVSEDINHLYLTEAELKDIYQKYYNSIPEETFWDIIKADPTYNPQKEQKMGKYGKWLLNLFRQNKLKLEDLYKATEYLSYFNKYYNKIQQKDINQYDSLSALYNVIKQFKDAAENGEELATSKTDEIRKIKEDAEKFYEDDTWLVVIPHTQEAACYYGKNTEWCTAATSSYNMFNHYYDEGLLYINICKPTNKKYQFHFETCQFMDENDNPINVPIVSNIPLTQGLIKKYTEKYGGKALLLLTKPIDFADEGEESIQGEEPYYSYIDYDGYTPIVKINGINVEYVLGDLTVENNVEFLGGSTFRYNDNDEEDNVTTVLFNAETRQMVEGNFNRISPINKNYTQYRNGDNNESLEVIDTNTMETVFSNPTGMIESISKYLRWTDGWVTYDDNIVYFRNSKQTDKWGGGKFQTLKIEMFYNLKTKQYIYPKQFGEYQWEIGRKLLDDNKYYLTFRSKYATSDGKVPYVIMYGDGSLSEVIAESKRNNNKVINESYNNVDIDDIEQKTKIQRMVKESVRDFLFEQYLLEATLDDIYTKYYSNIPQEEFWQIIKTDPTWNEQSSQKMGKYGKWLLNQYKQGKMKMEDLYKYRESLEAFHKYNRQLDKKDIMAYGDGNQLYDAVKQFIENPDQATSKSDEVRRMKQNVEKVYEDDEWLILIPKSEDAAKYYGKGTRWCTAAEHNNYFNYYNQNGPLYININKQNGEKYQFHFESEQFMDSSDTPITGIISDTIDLSDGAMQYYKNIGKGYEINEKEFEDPDAEPEEEILYEGYGWSVTRYPDGDYVYIYGHDENYEIDLYGGKLLDHRGVDVEVPLHKIFPAEVIGVLYDQLSYNEFYNLIFGTDARIFNYNEFYNTNIVLQYSYANDNNQYFDAVLYKLNDDYSFNSIIDFSENGLYMTEQDKEEVRKNDGFGRVYLHDPQTNKMNIYDIKTNSFLFNENVDKFCGFYMPSGYIFSINDNIGHINVRNSEQEYTIPPMNENQKIEMIGARGNLGMVKFEGIDGLGIYLLEQHKYAFNEVMPSLSFIESSDDGSFTRTTLGLLTKGKNEKYISVYDLPKEIQNGYNNAATYFPNSDLPVVLNDGTVMTRTQYWRSQGNVYNVLIQLWKKYV